VRIVVTGASGFLGRRVVARLSAGHEVHAVVRDVRRLGATIPASVIAMDLAQPLERSRLPDAVDAIVHLAQGTAPSPDGPGELFGVNTAATQQLLEYGRQAGARQFVLASTGDVYGRRVGPCRETDPADPVSLYGATKYAAEVLLKGHGTSLAACTLRLFHPYGPGQSDRLIPRIAARILDRRPVRLHPDDRPRVTPIYVDDVVRAFERAIDLGLTGVVNVAGDRALTVRELTDEIGRVLEREPVYESSSEPSGDLMGDNSLMKRLLGDWGLVPVPAGLRRALADPEAAR
jgi:nucleoside-diphosphate-sugar epimerase